MKRMKLFIVIFCLTSILLSCKGTKIETKEDIAKQFLELYYDQYSYKEKISQAFEIDLDRISKGPIVANEEKIDDYINLSFGEILTEGAKEALSANRVLPDFKMIESNVISAKTINIQLEEAADYKEGTLSFAANILYTYEDGTLAESIERGLVWTRYVQRLLY